MQNYSKFLAIAFLFCFEFNSFGGEPKSKTSLFKPAQPAFSISDITDGLSIGVNGGGMLFYGDIAEYRFFPKPSDWNTSFRSGYAGYIEREIKWGLSARVQFEKGSLQGTKRPGPESHYLGFESDFYSFKGMAQFDLTPHVFKEDTSNTRRWYVHALAGAGMIAHRSYSFYRDLGGIYDKVGYENVDPGTKVSYREHLLDRKKRNVKLIIPVGAQFGYRLNYRTDITAGVLLNNMNGDELDTWVRGFSAWDKYGYYSVGLRYTFGRSEDDLVEKTEEKEGEMEMEGFESGDVDDMSALKRKSSGKMRRKKAPKGDELLELRLKLFETQLKLFEMQYLIGQ